ncbi:MAG: condensation domain-containing protein, partial [Candidatus Binatia bacterium]
LDADRRRGFQLDAAPLMRLALFHLDEADYRLIWTSHHALLDGRSHVIVLEEVFSFYNAFCGGDDLSSPDPLPYRAHIDWLEKQDPGKSESFWRSMLKGFTAPTTLMVERAEGAPSGGEERYGKQTTKLSAPLTQAIQSFARQHDLTPNTLFQGAWALLLSRYSSQEDIVFGAARAARHSSVRGAEEMVGLFINTLPVRARVPADMALLTWLKELRAQWYALRDYEHTPLVKVQEWSELPRGMPLFESILVFENHLLSSALQTQGTSPKNRDFYSTGTTNYPVTVVGSLGPELLLEIAYDRRRFDDAAVTRMLGHLRTLLEAMVTEPRRRLSAFPLLTETERHELLVEWNTPLRDYRRDKCLHELFEAQAERTPDAVAVVCEGKKLTYRELNRRANRLARYLRNLGVGPEVLVGICMERSLEMVVGIIGVLKAGGAYVPLDPAYPKDRLAFMMEDSRVSVVLTQQELMSGLPPNNAQIVCLDALNEPLETEASEAET